MHVGVCVRYAVRVGVHVRYSVHVGVRVGVPVHVGVASHGTHGAHTSTAAQSALAPFFLLPPARTIVLVTSSVVTAYTSNDDVTRIVLLRNHRESEWLCAWLRKT